MELPFKKGDIVIVKPSGNSKLSFDGARLKIVGVGGHYTNSEFLRDIAAYQKGFIFHGLSTDFIELDKNQIVIDILNDL